MTQTLSDSRDELPALDRPVVFARGSEMLELHQRFAARRSFLFHGGAGVGKTSLLLTVCREFSDVLYIPQNPTPRSLFYGLVEALFAKQQRNLSGMLPAGVSSPHTKTATAIKGIVTKALRNSSYLVVLDHVVRPSRSLAASVRELMVDCSVAVVPVSRSAHMEDSGFVLPMFPDRGERFELRNFDAGTAGQFAAWCARREALTAGNLAQFLDKVVAYSDGNPGAILQMVRMAKVPKYTSSGQIKTTPLYVDFKIAMVSQ